MKILIVGAGAIGGYFGGRLVEKGEDVTFLVREKRKQQLDRDGLIIESIHGDLSLKPKALLSGEKADPFDVIILSTKAYHLDGGIESIRTYAGDRTMILPLLNGIAHIEKLIDVFGEERVIGGLCFIETTLDNSGKVLQKSPIHDLVFGERNGEKTERILKLQDAFSGTKANFRLSENIMQDMWHKYLFITTASGVTSLFQSPSGPICEQELGLQTIERVLMETVSIMRAIGAPVAENIEEVQLSQIQRLGYEFKSSLQRDMEKGLPIEADHFFGYLLKQAQATSIQAPTLETIYANLKIYESRI
ncbi:ketopantoate reductase family protein [Bacillus sp. DTU_2020_1000418_1_SI_GHA_SEK_038]|uniref:ketopantoate reductase family protein n=1 Tax=Bacillus sp. DTU_2020_1000418_1_SI_GHA_SEK_038 TaxID=3077585 RepID=UPI0028EDD3E4|nr:ketopantoate reductase family protein [Bacillus sp. DTU_2020_1000418_1_SI_GHA_SEK_038]WNS76314.1 ketopantoate reductase family protein [Bacillus sp. DTU_2020_1000418_1_SI_GHA_SEK_038]